MYRYIYYHNSIKLYFPYPEGLSYFVHEKRAYVKIRGRVVTPLLLAYSASE